MNNWNVQFFFFPPRSPLRENLPRKKRGVGFESWVDPTIITDWIYKNSKHYTYYGLWFVMDLTMTSKNVNTDKISKQSEHRTASKEECLMFAEHRVMFDVWCLMFDVWCLMNTGCASAMSLPHHASPFRIERTRCKRVFCERETLQENISAEAENATRKWKKMPEKRE